MTFQIDFLIMLENHIYSESYVYDGDEQHPYIASASMSRLIKYVSNC